MVMSDKPEAEGPLAEALSHCTTDLETLQHAHADAMEAMDLIAQERDRLRGQVHALIPYARHFPTCDQVVINDHCACGLAQARRDQCGAYQV